MAGTEGGGERRDTVRHDVMVTDDALQEQLAAYAHAAWSEWMMYLFRVSEQRPDGTVTIPGWLVQRWTRQMTTPYADLPPEEQASDRKEAVRIVQILYGGAGDHG